MGCLLIYFVCRNNEVEDFKDISLDAVFDEDDSDMDGDDSDSDGYLSEVLKYAMLTLFLVNLILAHFLCKVFLTLLVMVSYQDTGCSYNGETRIENHLEGQEILFLLFLNFKICPFYLCF